MKVTWSCSSVVGLKYQYTNNSQVCSGLPSAPSAVVRRTDIMFLQMTESGTLKMSNGQTPQHQ